MRARRRENTIITSIAMVFFVGLIAVNAVWPSGFTVFIAIGGAAGALMVLYEVRLTKRIAQADFIRDLQTSFTSDANICELWKRLLLGEEITSEDRPLVSSYLTFFETLHLLVEQGALELAMADNLFRNRFFTAIGNKGILETALVSEAGSFVNIHDLIVNWHDHLIAHGAPIHSGYYSYVEALLAAKGIDVIRLGADDLPMLLNLQSEVIEGLEDKSQLRANSDTLLKECLSGHVTLGAFDDGKLVGAAVLYDGGLTDESIRGHLTQNPPELERSVNLKVILVAPTHRRAGVARTLIELLECEASKAGKSEILCTVHPKNGESKALFAVLGYRRLARVSTTYGRRDIFARSFPVTNKRWAR